MKLLKIQELLYQAFDFFNERLCEGSLPVPVITILSRGSKRRTLGWMWADKWQEGDDIMHEISISAETIDRSFEDVCHTLLHEMAHLYNAHANIRDCSPTGRHNKKFKITAEDIFKLEVHKDPKLGWAYTDLTDTSRALVADFKAVASIQEWQLKRLDKVKCVAEKIYTVQLTQEQKEWLKEQSEEEEIKPRELLSRILDEYMAKTT